MVAEKLQLSMEELSEGGLEIPMREVSLKHEPESDKLLKKCGPRPGVLFNEILATPTLFSGLYRQNTERLEVA